MNAQSNTGEVSEKEIREAKNLYFRDWRANNKDKVQAINTRYWDKRAKKAQSEGENT